MPEIIKAKCEYFQYYDSGQRFKIRNDKGVWNAILKSRAKIDVGNVTLEFIVKSQNLTGTETLLLTYNLYSGFVTEIAGTLDSLPLSILPFKQECSETGLIFFAKNSNNVEDNYIVAPTPPNAEGSWPKMQ